MAGIVPGLVTGLALMVINYYISKKRNYEKRTEPYTGKQIRDITTKSLIVLIMPALIVGGILSGVYTATESAAAASAYALIIGFVFFRQLKFRQIPDIFINSRENQRHFRGAPGHQQPFQLRAGHGKRTGQAGRVHAQPDPEQICIPDNPQLRPFHHRLPGGPCFRPFSFSGRFSPPSERATASIPCNSESSSA